MTATRAKTEREEYVVLEIVDGIATDVVHFPAPERYGAQFAAHMADGTTPASWPTMCGRDGPVYRRAGALANVAECRDCRSARSSRLIALGLRIDECRLCGAPFEQKAGQRGRPHEYCPAHDSGWYARNKDEIAEKQRAYREANKDEIAEKQRAYREANKATDPLIRECKGCGGRFAQEQRQGHPLSYCGRCRPGAELLVLPEPEDALVTEALNHQAV